MLHNTSVNNVTVPAYAQNFAQWHHDRNLIEGTDDTTQFTKALEEFVEVYMALHPKTEPTAAVMDIEARLDQLLCAGRIKRVEDSSTLADSIGDVNVVFMNFMERHKISLVDCFSAAWGDIEHRKGKMINGTFVKEEDL